MCRFISPADPAIRSSPTNVKRAQMRYDWSRHAAQDLLNAMRAVGTPMQVAYSLRGFHNASRA